MKKAFTLIELIFVIIVLGVLAATVLPRMTETKIQEAADQILSHIRYTQHLAMMDNVYESNTSASNWWYYKRWRISFRDCAGASTDKYYVIYKDLNNGGPSAAPNKTESAKSPVNGKYLYDDGSCGIDGDESSEVLIGRKYGINSLTNSGGCASQYIAFDSLGRPFSSTYGTNPVDGIMTVDCNLTFSDGTDSFTITITKETGYSYISSISY